MMKQVFNPYLPSWEYVPDGEPHVFNNRLYIYGSHDRFDGTTYCMEPYTCWSCPIDDLTSWTNHGVIYTGKDDPLNDTGSRLMFAPDVVEKDGIYYLYYGLDTANTISVAKADKPEGPYTFYGHVKHCDEQIWGLKQGDKQQFDPGVFKDDDGRVYLYSGFSSTPEVIERIKKKLPPEALESFNVSTDGNRVVELDDDMLTIVGEVKDLLPGVSNSKGTGFEGHEFFEASSMRKFNGKYYAIYSSVQGHELCYAISDHPDSGFIYKGVLHSNGNIGISDKPTYYYANNHGSVVEINGHYYIFGHRHTNHSQYCRQGVAEELHMNEDGTFNQAEMTSCGLNQKPLVGKGIYPAYIACVLMSKDGVIKSDIKMDKITHPAIRQDSIINIQEGTVIGYKYFDFENVKSISITTRGNGKGILHVRTSVDGNNLASIELESNQDWKEYKVDIVLNAKNSPLYFIYDGIGKIEIKQFELN